MPKGIPSYRWKDYKNRAKKLKSKAVKVVFKKQVNSKKDKRAVYFKEGGMDKRVKEAMRFANGKTNAVVVIR